MWIEQQWPSTCCKPWLPGTWYDDAPSEGHALPSSTLMRHDALKAYVSLLRVSILAACTPWPAKLRKPVAAGLGAMLHADSALLRANGPLSCLSSLPLFSLPCQTTLPSFILALTRRPSSSSCFPSACPPSPPSPPSSPSPSPPPHCPSLPASRASWAGRL